MDADWMRPDWAEKSLVVAMSGGVDSSVAAWMLEQGGAKEYAAEYLATLTVDPATTGRGAAGVPVGPTK